MPDSKVISAEQLVKEGRLKEALAALQQEVRNKPEDQRLRVFLFQINCVIGQLDKALNQLQVISSLSAETMLLAQIFQPVITCELLRREVFAGKRTPLIFGEPMEWIGFSVQANELAGKGQHAAAMELRDKAFEAAPTTSGRVNDAAFSWIADADARLGPLLEAIIDRKYYWVPFCRIKKIVIPAPTDLRDLVWTPAEFVWANGGAVSGHIPCRYPQTESSTDDGLRLARKTEWSEPVEGYNIGVGQRVLATDNADYSLLECRTIELEPEPVKKAG
jgi:type VI secretion system protein ImpE